MIDLVYCDAPQGILAKRFPDAKIEDASDWLHPERFSIELNDSLKDDYFKFIIKEGYGEASIGVQIMLLDKDTRSQLKKYLDDIKAEQEPTEGLREGE